MSKFSWLGIVRRGIVWETIPLEQAVRSDAHRWTILALFVFATLWLVVVVYQVDALPVPEYSLPPWDVHDKVEIWSTRSTLVDHEDLPWILVTSPLASGHKMWGEKCVSVLHSPPPYPPSLRSISWLLKQYSLAHRQTMLLNQAVWVALLFVIIITTISTSIFFFILLRIVSIFYVI